MAHNYPKETAYENSPEQVKRRMARNRARAAAIRSGKAKKGDGKEVDHIGANRKGPLDNSKVRVITKVLNRKKQPKRDGSED
jgi:hypothetical protein